ncbi:MULTISPECIES: PIN domain-containing protein [Bacillaceae]|uniref:PIN domain-containing protein n=1 Tax=Bacillaceae TaxID=186817 RepID=UPI002964FBFC|nr:PIN domain-containing protein [Bacillus infantis]MDW2878154.1 PIN domain-containing protein [Bacillus infantis]
MLKVFLDSNIIFSDPFFKGNFSRKFVDAMIELRGNLVISNLVYEESKNNYRREIKKRRKELGKIKHKLNKILITEVENTYKDDEFYVKEFIDYYQDMIDKGFLEIVSYNDFEIFDEIIKRSLIPKKPFDHHKEEFKDTVIWLSYSNYVEKNELSNCFFISNNTSDYYDSDKIRLHPDLLEDTQRIKPYKSIEDFMKHEVEPLLEEQEKQYEQLLDWAEVHLEEKYVEDIIKTEFVDELTNELSYFVNHLDAHEIRHIASTHDDYSQAEFNGILSVNLATYERELYSNEIIIYGSLNIWSDVSLFLVKRDKVEEDTLNVGSMGMNQKVEFTFTIGLDYLPANFEVKRIETEIY